MVILRTKISNFTCFSSSTVLWFYLFFLLLSSPSHNFYLEEGMMLGSRPGKRLDPLFLCLNCAGLNRQLLSHWHFQHDSSASSAFSISIWEDQIRALSSFESRNAWSYTVPGSYLVHLRMVANSSCGGRTQRLQWCESVMRFCRYLAAASTVIH